MRCRQNMRWPQAGQEAVGSNAIITRTGCTVLLKCVHQRKQIAGLLPVQWRRLCLIDGDATSGANAVHTVLLLTV